MAPIRLLLIHGHPLMADALARSLTRQAHLELVGCVRDLPAAIVAIDHDRPDLVLIDAAIAPPPAVEWTLRLRRRRPGLKIVPMGLGSEREVLAFLEAGAAGYVLDRASLSELAQTLVAVHRGVPPCSAQVVANVWARIAELAAVGTLTPRSGAAELTPREAEVLELVARGLRNKEIAQELAITVPTVKNHVHAILGKLQVGGRREAIVRAYEQGILRRRAARAGRAG